MTEQLSQKHSPFKFLDAFAREDRNIFFGRGEEVENLYQYVNKNRLVLVYGQSGTGKTSLVQCGLANRFEVTDWIPFFIRRGKNINESLLQVISQSKALGGAPINKQQLNAALERISARYLRPVYLVFDQFEELLILGDEGEKEQFLATLEGILYAEETQSCNLLFIMREEYFAWLDAFERRIPGFSDRRLRVEPMRPSRIGEVITKSCTHFNITLEHPAKNAEQIIQSLSGKTGISLPYLQVYLDMLWREDYVRTYPAGWKEDGLPPLVFTTQEIQDFGAIRNILERFLSERTEAIQGLLARKYPNLAPDTLRNVLDAFATEEGTKRPIGYQLEMGMLIPNEQAPEAIRHLPPALLTDCLLELEQSRIIRSDGDTYELAHDTLANLIDQQRTDTQRQRNEMRRRILTSYHSFAETSEYLTRKQVALYEEFIPYMRLDEPVLQFVEESKTYVKEQEELLLRLEQKKRRQATVVAVGGIILALFATIASGYAWTLKQKANNAEQVAIRKSKEVQKTLELFEEEKKIRDTLEANDALQFVNVLLNADDDNLQKAIVELEKLEDRGNSDPRIIQKLNELKGLIKQY